MSHYTLRQLELFCALEGHETLAAAAASVHLSESALSHAITQLEQSLGEKLCVRRKARGFELTSGGREFARRARVLLHDAADLYESFANRDGVLSGPVALGCYRGLVPHVLPTLIEAFAHDHPLLDIHVVDGEHDELLEALTSGTLDVAILYDNNTSVRLNRARLYETEMLAVLPYEHRLAGAESVSLPDLESEPLIMVDTFPGTSNTENAFRERGLTPSVKALLPAVDLVRSLVARGLGYTLLMSRPHASDITSDGLRVASRALDPREVVTDVVAVWPRDTRLNPRAAAVVDFASGAFRDEPLGA